MPLSRMIAALAGWLLTSGAGMAQTTAPTAKLTLGTATAGGGFPVYGDAYAAMLNAQEPGIRIETRNTKGSTENVPLLEAGYLDLGLVAVRTSKHNHEPRIMPRPVARRRYQFRFQRDQSFFSVVVHLIFSQAPKAVAQIPR